MSNMQSNVRTTVIGTVTAVYQPGWKVSNAGNEYLAGGKLVLDSKEGVCEVSFLQLYVDNKKTEDMPQIWKDIDTDWIKGKRVAVACVFASDYPNPTTGVVKHQYKNPTDIQYLDEDPPTQGEPEQNSEDAPPPPVQHNVDPNQMRIMRQSTLHYASLLMVPLVKDFDHPQTMIERTIWLAGKLLEYVISGEMPFEPEVEADEPDEFESLGSI